MRKSSIREVLYLLQEKIGPCLSLLCLQFQRKQKISKVVFVLSL